MAFRFRKSVKIAPGLRLNFSKSGVSTTIGGRGASVNVGRRGTFVNAGVPGLSTRNRVGGGAARPRRQRVPAGYVLVTYHLNDDGTVDLRDRNGSPLSDKLKRMARKQHKELIRQWLEEQCQLFNQGIEVILEVHRWTPDSRVPRTFIEFPFEAVEPRKAWYLRMGLGRIFKRALQQYQDSLHAWSTEKVAHEQEQVRRRQLFEEGRHQTEDEMSAYLEEVLSLLHWPRETQVSYELRERGTQLLLDVDLPEAADVPAQQASVSSRGNRLLVKNKSAAQRRKEYMRHIHGVGFRLIGEAFSALPSVQTMLHSGFSPSGSQIVSDGCR